MIYLDNSATTLKKPREVTSAVADCLNNYCANPGRGGHKACVYAGEKVYECRELICDMFNAPKSENVIFTSNATESLNLAIKGFLKPGDHAVFSSMEHNSVVRPFYSLKDKGISFSVARGDVFGRVSLESILGEIRENTKLVCLVHVSNVCGTVNDISGIGRELRKRNIAFLVDATQSAGILPIDMEKDCIDFLAITGHKALMGPTGTGALLISENVNLNPLKEGGTGSFSKLFTQPDEYPDKFESGTLNTAGIVGLGAGIKFINGVGLSNIREHDRILTQLLLEDLSVIRGVNVFGYLANVRRTGVVSFNAFDIDVTEIAQRLDSEYDIAVRAGYHCAYMAHQTIGSDLTGTVRLSIGAFNTKSDIKTASYAINKIIN